MNLAIGVYPVRDRAEDAVRELVARGVPEHAIVYLTPVGVEAEDPLNQIDDTGFTGTILGITPAVARTTLIVPGIGPVFSLGLGAAALLGVPGAPGRALMDEIESAALSMEYASQQDTEFLRQMLRDGRSIVMIRPESKATAAVATEIFARTGMSLHGRAPVAMRTSVRTVDDVTIVDVHGRITSAEGNVMLRGVVSGLLNSNALKILLNLQEVDYVDSSGLGELVRAHTSARNRGGQLKLVNLQQRVRDLMRITMVHSALDIQPDEATAIQAFRIPGQSSAVA